MGSKDKSGKNAIGGRKCRTLAIFGQDEPESWFGKKLKSSSTALLIVDAQYALLDGDPPAVRNRDVLSSLNLAIAKARLLGMPVIFIQHDGSANSPLAPDAKGWQIHPELTRVETDTVIRKTVGDCFYAPMLHNLLQKLGVRSLWVGGCATDFCVDTAVRTALSHDYAVTVIADGHTCRNRPFANGETVIDHFNWVWSEMSEAPQALRVQLAINLA